MSAPNRGTPEAWIAICQCGQTIGAVDRLRSPVYEVSATLSRWLHRGCTIEPRWGSFRASIKPCTCERAAEGVEA